MDIPLYKQQKTAGVVREPRGSVASAGAGWEGVAQAGRAISQAGDLIAQYKAKQKQEVDSARLAEEQNTLQNNWKSASDTLSQMTDPKEQEAFYNNWIKSENDRIEALDIDDDVRRKLNVSWLNIQQSSDNDVNGAVGYIAKSNRNIADNSWVTIQESALDGQGWTEPVTQEEMTPEQAYDYATNKRIGLGTVDFADGEKSKRKFGQTMYYRSAYRMLDTNFDLAVEETDTEKMSPEQASLWEIHKMEVQNRITDNSKKVWDKESGQATAELNRGELTTSYVEKKMSEMVPVGAGKKVPAISEANGKALIASVAGGVEKDKSLIDYTLVIDSIADGLEKGDIDRSEMDKVFLLLADRKGNAVFTTETTKQLLNMVENSFATGRKYDPSAFKSAYKIPDLYASAFRSVVNEYRKSVDIIGRDDDKAIQDLQGRMNSLFNMFDEKGANLEKKDINEWMQTSMNDVLLTNAEQTMRGIASRRAKLIESKDPTEDFELTVGGRFKGKEIISIKKVD